MIPSYGSPFIEDLVVLETTRTDSGRRSPTAVASLIGSWVADLKLGDIPSDILCIARNCVIDTLGVALAGSVHPLVRKVRAVADSQYGDGYATMVGSTRRISAPGAALVNAAAAHVLEFDDNCNSGFVHGSAVILPAALAMAEMEDVSGGELLVGFIAGAEAEFAIGDAATRHLYEKGWWTTDVLGQIGAAAASARIMRLDAQATTAAIGLAVTGTGGGKACFGSDAKSILCGRASETGIVAALLARTRCTGPPDAFEARGGFVELFNDGIFEKRCFSEFGRKWRLSSPGIDVKRVPVCLSAHAAMDGVKHIMTENGLAASDVVRIVCDVSPLVAANLAYNEPQTPQQAQFSLPFAVGCILLHGNLKLCDLDRPAMVNSELREAMKRVTMITSRRWTENAETRAAYPEGAFVEVTTRDGRILSSFAGHAHGTAANPLTAVDIKQKFMRCAEGAIGETNAQRLLEQIQTLEMLPSARSLLASI